MPARAAIIPAIGAGCSPIPASSSSMRWRRIVGPTGQIRIPRWCRTTIPQSVRRALADCEVASGPGEPAIDPDWGEPGLTLAEKVYAWCTFEILAMTRRQSRQPRQRHSAAGLRRAAQLRFVVGVDPSDVSAGAAPPSRPPRLSDGARSPRRATRFSAPRASIPIIPGRNGPRPRSPATTGRRRRSCPTPAARCPTTSSPKCSGLPTIWVPHSYRGCSQHAPDEHLPTALAREALALMAGIYWDLGEPGTPGRG